MSELLDLQQNFCNNLIERNDNNLSFISSAVAVERLAVYRKTVIMNIINSLQITYPNTWKLLGKDCANSVAYQYLKSKQNFPITGCLDDFGANFSKFLAILPQLKSLIYLQDFAYLEWLQHLAELAIDETFKADNIMQQLATNDVSLKKIKLSSGLLLMQSKYPLTKIAESISNNSSITINVAYNYFIIYRLNYIVQVLTMPKSTWYFIDYLKSGNTIQQSCLLAANIDENFDLIQTFTLMLQNKLIVDFF